MATVYEWVVEEIEDGDICDVNYFGSYSEARSQAFEGCRVALHKAVSGRNGDQDDMLVSAYAYVDQGILPSIFDNGDAVPKRYLSEIKDSK